MGLMITKDSCDGCRKATHTQNLKCVYCGYDYYEEAYGRPRPDEPKTRKEREAWRTVLSARNDFLSVINDVNNEYGTSITVEDVIYDQ